MNAANHKTVGLLLIGGLHHILHLVPIASELETVEGLKTVIFVTNAAEQAEVRDVLLGLGLKQPDIRILSGLRVLRRFSPKLSVLFGHIGIWKKLDALIVVERTSTILRYIPRALPLFIHIPHGAGDRAKSYDPRIRHFDHVLVAGDKDKARMIELGIVSEKTCHVTGYIKPYAVRQIDKTLPKLFETTRPVVFYNPHFSKALSSWDDFGAELLEAFSQDKTFNYIIAPHMRLFADAPEAVRQDVLKYAAYENMHIDLGSERSVDMTYTRSADIYLGDVSSQVYEFLSEPKPCVFIGKSDVQWDGNPDYAHWSYGKVCHSADKVMQSLNSAKDDHTDYADIQKQGCRAAMGYSGSHPIKKAASIVQALLGLNA